MSSSKGSWFDVEDEDEDKNEELEINGKVLKFRNKICRDCGKCASIYISESTANSNKLYYKCDNKTVISLDGANQVCMHIEYL